MFTVRMVPVGVFRTRMGMLLIVRLGKGRRGANHQEQECCRENSLHAMNLAREPRRLERSCVRSHQERNLNFEALCCFLLDVDGQGAALSF